MAGLNANYMIAPSLQDYFVNKTTGLPLSGGFVYFYQDNNRSSLKTVYELVDGGSSNYSYAALPNPVTLSAVGTMADNAGNDIIPYYYPYDSNGNVQLYYIYVTDANGVEQFTRSAWPNLVAQTEMATNFENFMSNGQFTYNSPPNGNVSAATTFVAPGGWIYDRSTGASDTDNVSFPRFNEYTQDPENAPRYAANIQCLSAGNATYKYFGARFYNVNTFASDTQEYTLGFYALASSSFTMNVYVRKYFGTGGSPTSTVTTNVGSVVIPTSYGNAPYALSFTFGGNESYSLGTNNDDYVDVLLGLPLSTAFSVSVTDMMLVLGEQTSLSYPVETASQQAYQSFVGSQAINTYQSYANNYLPVVYSPNGYIPFSGDVGRIVSRVQTTAPIGELPLTGGTYVYSNTSSDLIPYSRLGNILWNSSANEYIWGTGSNFVTALISTGATADVMLFGNEGGSSQVAAADGATSTGFTFTTICSAKSAAIPYNVQAVFAGSAYSNGFIVRGIVGGSVTAVNAGTSSFSVSQYRNNNFEYQFFSVVPIAGSGLTGGDYFTFSNTTTNYYVWFKNNGSGADPAPGGTGIQVNILSTDSITDVSQKIVGALNGGVGTNIAVVTGGSVVAGSYFTFTDPSAGAYYVWFQVNGAGTQPSVPGVQPILVNVPSGDTAAQVAVLIKAAINKYKYGLINAAGLVLMGQDTADLFTVDGSDRANNFGILGSTTVNGALGSLGYSYGLYHTHTAATTTTTTTSVSLNTNAIANVGSTPGSGVQFCQAAASTTTLSINTQATYTAASSSSSTTTITGSGNQQSQPYSLTVNYFIKY